MVEARKLTRLFVCMSMVALLYAVPVHATIVDISPSGDAFVYQPAPNNNYGTGTAIQVGNNTTHEARGFMDFDLSSLAGMTVQSATLYLHPVWWNNTARTFAFYKSLTDWTETGVTWNNWASGTGGVAGTDYEATEVFSDTWYGYMSGYDWATMENIGKVYDVTALTQSWVSNPSTNKGFYIAALDNDGSTPNPGSWSGGFLQTGESTQYPAFLKVEFVPEPVTMVMLLTGGIFALRRKS